MIKKDLLMWIVGAPFLFLLVYIVGFSETGRKTFLSSLIKSSKQLEEEEFRKAEERLGVTKNE